MFHHLGLSDTHVQLMMWVGGSLLLLVLLLGLGLWWQRRIQARQLARINQLFSISDIANSLDLNRNGKRAGRSVDTLFILPDISNYTRFVTNTHLDPAETQDIIFALMSTIIKTAGRSFRFSKMEGDSALFFTDAHGARPRRVAKHILRIFVAYDQERERLKAVGNYDAPICALIDELGLKMILHRGTAQRFTYRGTIDHFGSDVIQLHRLAKNHIDGSRYVFATEQACDLVDFENALLSEKNVEVLKHIGPVQGTVFRIPADFGSPPLIESIKLKSGLRASVKAPKLVDATSPAGSIEPPNLQSTLLTRSA